MKNFTNLLRLTAPKAPVRTLPNPSQQRNAGFHPPPPSIPRPHTAPTGTPQNTVHRPSSLATAWVGSYRIAYQVLDGELVVLVVEVGDRRDVHRDI